jgi:hypothetical protein
MRAIIALDTMRSHEKLGAMPRFKTYNTAMKYLYWVAFCKTFGCKNMTAVRFDGLCVEGRPDKFEIYAPNHKIALKCSVCLKSYEYEAGEIIAVVKNDPPPLDFVNLV